MGGPPIPGASGTRSVPSKKVKKLFKKVLTIYPQYVIITMSGGAGKAREGVTHASL